MSQVLFVDDDENLLAGYQRNLRKSFALATAPGGAEALALTEREGPFAVVVSDMRMPGMDGVQFLAQMRERYPDTVRIMLTGQADLDDAVQAVNEGNIFRFLTKPCDAPLLAKAVTAALEQNRLITAERELLEKTLNGSVKLLVDVLSLANPEAFSRAERLRRLIKEICAAHNLGQVWQFELSAQLSQLGCITLPVTLLQRYHAGLSLSEEEQKQLASVPAIGRDLLINIPRLEPIAQMISGSSGSPASLSKAGEWTQLPPVELGSLLLRTVLAYDDLVTREKQAPAQAVVRLLQQPDVYPVSAAEALRAANAQKASVVKHRKDVFTLTTEMVLAEDIRTRNGVFLAPAGREVTATLIKFIENYAYRGEIEPEVAVFLPA
ncbi:MAG: response regulator [candidate division FCPU426 bacterium]